MTRWRLDVVMLFAASLLSGCGGAKTDAGAPPPSAASCSGGACEATCTAGGACRSANPCKQGTRTCSTETGAAACIDAADQPDGTPCDGHSVCKQGACAAVTCAPGELCQPDNPCTLGATTCASGTSQPGCMVTGNKPDGTSCGAGLACSGGACVPVSGCTPGAACDPSDPCSEGALSCAAGRATCVASRTRADGSACGGGLVCSAGRCISACVAGAACTLPDECAIGATSCATAWAAPTCGAVGNRPDGTPCGNGRSCASGACVASDRTPPRVDSRAPAPGATNVWSRAAITATFDEALDPRSVVDRAVVVAAEGGVDVPKALALSDDGRTLTITPLSLPALPTTLTVSLTPQLTDLAGNGLVAPSDPWSWQVPAWQSMGYVPKMPQRYFHGAAAAIDAAGTVHVAMSSAGLSWPGAALYSWHDGWSGAAWSESPGDRVALALDASGQPALAWFDDESLASPPHPPSTNVVSTLSAGAWTRSELASIDAGLRVRENRLRHDGQGRLVSAWITTDAASPSAVSLHVRRLDGGSWRQLGDDPVATWTPVGGVAAWDLAFDADGEPLLAWDPGVATSAYRGATVRAWNGSAWIAPSLGAPAGSPSPRTSEPLWPRLVAGQTIGSVPRAQAYVSWYDTSASPPAFRVMLAGVGAVHLGDVVFSGPAGTLAPVALGADGAPIAVWLEGAVLCGKRWDGQAWRPLASDVPCLGVASAVPVVVEHGGPDVLLACSVDVHGNLDRFPQLLCARYNGYALTP